MSKRLQIAEHGTFEVRVRNALFPLTPSLAFCLLALLASLDLGRVSPLSAATTFIDKTITAAVGLRLFRPVLSLTLSSLSLFVLLIVLRFALRQCLSYTGWLREERGRQLSLPTRAFMLLVGGLGRIPATTMAYQSIVPTQPLPPLRETINRYLRSMRGILSAEEHAALAEQAILFEKEHGRGLQRQLLLKWLTSSNYVADWWRQFVYLRGRGSLIRANVAGYDWTGYPTTTVQAARAARITLLHLEFARDVIVNQSAKPISMGGIPLCSQQYADFYRTTRLPAEGFDKVVRLPSTTRHIAVNCRGCWYTVDVVKEDGTLVKPVEFEKALQSIIDFSHQPSAGEERLAALTAGPRDLWARIRRDKFAYGVNKASLSAIEESLEVIYLDDEDIETGKDDDRAYARALHGDGYKLWCDKTNIYIFSRNGKFLSNVEHSPADAVIFSHMVEYTKYHEAFEPSYDDEGHCVGNADHVPDVRRLDWQLDDETQLAITEAFTFSSSIAVDLENRSLHFTEFGKDVMKKAKVSPDAFIQMALQLAFFEDQGHFDLTYESALLRLFRDGRTETIRSCTPESCDFVNAMLAPEQTSTSRLALLRRACEQHQQLTRDAMAGQGCDRHLFALYVVSKHLELESPFLETAFGRPFALSTSQVPQHQTVEFSSRLNGEPRLFYPAGSFCCPEGGKYGVCYSICPSGLVINFHISTWKSIESTNADRFSQRICTALRTMRTVVDEAMQQ